MPCLHLYKFLQNELNTPWEVLTTGIQQEDDSWTRGYLTAIWSTHVIHVRQYIRSIAQQWQSDHPFLGETEATCQCFHSPLDLCNCCSTSSFFHKPWRWYSNGKWSSQTISGPNKWKEKKKDSSNKGKIRYSKNWWINWSLLLLLKVFNLKRGMQRSYHHSRSLPLSTVKIKGEKLTWIQWRKVSV